MSKPTVEPLRLGRKKRIVQPKPIEEKGPVSHWIWEFLEREAPTKFYINDKTHPAFLLFPKWHVAASKRQCYLYMNTVGLLGKFRTEKKALTYLKNLVENANFPLKVYKVSKYGRKKDEFIFFAENIVQRIELTEHPTRAFNINRWGISE